LVKRREDGKRKRKREREMKIGGGISDDADLRSREGELKSQKIDRAQGASGGGSIEKGREEEGRLLEGLVR